MNITTATPAQIDAILFPLEAKIAHALDAVTRYEEVAERESFAYRADMYRGQAAKAAAEADTLTDQAAPLRAEYTRRGGWTRYYLCTANNGHVHSSTWCTTTYVTTQFAACPEQSGMTAAELVDVAGERACTVCFPEAPTAALTRPSRLAFDVRTREEKAARAADLAAKRAAKDAKAITAVDGAPLRVTLRGYPETIATVVSAWRVAVEIEADHKLYGYSFGEADRAGQAQIVEALAVKLGQSEDEVRATLAKKVAAKVKRG